MGGRGEHERPAGSRQLCPKALLPAGVAAVAMPSVPGFDSGAWTRPSAMDAAVVRAHCAPFIHALAAVSIGRRRRYRSHWLPPSWRHSTAERSAHSKMARISATIVGCCR